MKLLVTGASGFIGAHVAAGLRSDGHAVHAPTRRELDLADAAAVHALLRREHYDVVIHAAHENGQRLGLADGPAILSRNLRFFHAVAAASEQWGRLVFFGSGAEYGRDRWHARMREDELGAHLPADEYGFSRWLLNEHARSHARVVNLRCFAVYGPGEDWRVRFLSNTICRALLGLPVIVRQDVEFDFLHVDDLVDVTRWAVGVTPKHSDYNVATGTTHALVALATQILRAAGRDERVEVVRPGLGRAYGGDPARLLAEHAREFRRVEAEIPRLVAWYSDRIHTIDPALFADPATGALPQHTEPHGDAVLPNLPR